MTDPHPNPFVGPLPFVEGQKLFGRDADSQALVDLVVAKRIVLLMSPSGAGKTSLIQAAVVPRLRKHLSPLAPIRFTHRGGTSARGNRYVLNTLAALEERLPPEERLTTTALARLTLPGYARRVRPALDERSRTLYPLLVFDQFEELFTADRTDWEAKADFLQQLGQMLSGGHGAQEEDDDTLPPGEPQTPFWALFSIREDYVAELDPYLNLLPTALAFRQRLLPLEPDQALAAIQGAGGDQFQENAARALIEDLRTVQRPAGNSARGRRTARGRFIEPLLLQVTCMRLWERVVIEQGRPIATNDIVEAVGTEVDGALAHFYDTELAAAAQGSASCELALRDFIESRLLARGTIRTRFLSEEVPAAVAEGVAHLEAVHILKRDMSGDREWLELSHDRLVAPVCASNQLWRDQHLSVLQKQAKLWNESNRSRDLLVAGEQLTEAERHEAEGGLELSSIERAFLDACREQRKHLQDELASRAALAAMNTSLRNQRLGLFFGILAALFLAGWLGLTLDNLKTTKNQLEASGLDLRLIHAALMAREGNVREGTGLLALTMDQVQKRGEQGKGASIDMAHVRILGRLPPMEARLGSHADQVKALTFVGSPAELVSAGWDGSLKFWKNGQLVQTLKGHSGKVVSVAYSRTAGVLASADENGKILLHRTQAAGFAPPATLDWAVGEGPGDPGQARRAHLTSIAINADGTLLAASSWTKTITLWDISTPEAPRKLAAFGPRLHKTVIYKLEFIPAGPSRNQLVSVDWNGLVGLWNTASAPHDRLERSRNTGGGQGVSLFALAVHPQGRWVVSGDKKGGLHVWDLEGPATGAVDASVSDHNSRETVFGMTFSEDGQNLYTVGGENLNRWSVPATASSAAEFARELKAVRLPGWGERLYSIAHAPGTLDRVALGGSRSVMLASPDRPSMLSYPIARTALQSQSWRALAASGDLKRLLMLGQDGKTVYPMRRTATGSYESDAPVPHAGYVAGIGMTTDGKASAVQLCNGEIRVHGADDRWVVLRAAFDPKAKGCAAKHVLAFSPPGTLLASAHGRRLDLWKRAGNGTWESVDRKELGGEILSLAFNGAGNTLAVAGRLDRIELWDTAGARLAQRLSSRGSIATEVVALAFGADGKRLLSSADNVELAAWTVADMKRDGGIADLHERTVTSIAVAPRHGSEATFTADRAGQLVSCFGALTSANCVRLGRPFGNGITGLALSADGNTLVVAGDGLFSWNLARADMMGMTRRLVEQADK